MPSRRAVLLGGSAAVVAGAAAVAVAQHGDDRPAHTSGAGVEPVEAGSFRSAYRHGARTQWRLVRPPGAPEGLPVVVALHGRGGSAATLLGPRFRLDRHLAAAARHGIPPFAIATVDGGSSYWHPRPDGEDTGATVVDELLPMLRDRGLDVSRIGLLGWSMGGYGALRLAGLLGPRRVGAVVACSPAIWSDPDSASRAGFVDAAEYRRFSVVGHQDRLAGIPVRIDCGRSDPFYRDVRTYVAAFPPSAHVVSTFEPGGHESPYWRRMLPRQLAFLGRRVGLGSEPSPPAA